MSALTLSAHKAVHQRTKHIDVKYHFVRSLVSNKDVKLNYVNTKFNIAKILTKIVDTSIFGSLISLITATKRFRIVQSQHYGEVMILVIIFPFSLLLIQ